MFVPNPKERLELQQSQYNNSLTSGVSSMLTMLSFMSVNLSAKYVLMALLAIA
jgi:hypothetical protein